MIERMMEMRSRVILATMFLFLGVGFFLGGCVPAPPTEQVEKPVVMVSVQPPPIPPGPEELERPPNIILEKPKRDPFIALVGPGGPEESAAKKGSKAQGGGPSSTMEYVITGILIGGSRNSAVLQAGESSYIIHVGDRIDRYVVRSITPNSVVLMKGSQKLTLTYFAR